MSSAARWDDDRLDQEFEGLGDRLKLVEAEENERKAIAALPGCVIALDSKVDRIDDRTKGQADAIRALSEAHDRSRRDQQATREEIAAGRDDIAALRKQMRDDFERVHQAHDKANAPKSRRQLFMDTMAWLAPIIAAGFAAYLALKGASPGPPK